MNGIGQSSFFARMRNWKGSAAKITGVSMYEVWFDGVDGDRMLAQVLRALDGEPGQRNPHRKPRPQSGDAMLRPAVLSTREIRSAAVAQTAVTRAISGACSTFDPPAIEPG